MSSRIYLLCKARLWRTK